MKKVLTLFATSVILSGCLGGGSEEYNEALTDHSSYHCQGKSFDPNSVRDKSEVLKVYCEIKDFESNDLSPLSQFSNLEELHLNGFQTKRLQSVVFNSSWTPKLKILMLSDINFETIDLSQLAQVERLTLNNIEMSNLDITSLSALKHFQLDKTNLTALDFSYNTALESVVVKETKIEELNFSNNTNLVELALALNSEAQPSIELTNQPVLKSLSILSQELESLYINLPNLESAHLSNNKLSSTDFSGSPELSALQLSDNLIKEINVDANEKLTRLILTGNPLSEEAKDYLKNLTWIDEIEY
jgi:hypothetical protein